MKKRITHINPLQLAKILGGIYCALLYILFPILFLVLLITRSIGVLEGVLLMIFAPLIYGIIAFIAGLIIGAMYNWLAIWTGGIEVTVEDVPPAAD